MSVVIRVKKTTPQEEIQTIADRVLEGGIHTTHSFIGDHFRVEVRPIKQWQTEMAHKMSKAMTPEEIRKFPKMLELYPEILG